MSKPDNRGSLMNLRPNLTKVAPIVTTEEMENVLFGQVAEPTGLDVGLSVRKDVRTDHASKLESASRNPGPKTAREGVILLNAKIPVSLHTRLKRTSQFNDVSMTDILLRGIETELESGRYQSPPSSWGADKPE